MCRSSHANDEEQTLLQDEEDPSSTTRPKQGKEDALSIVQVFRHPDYYKAAIAVIMVMLAQQPSGMFLFKDGSIYYQNY